MSQPHSALVLYNQHPQNPVFFFFFSVLIQSAFSESYFCFMLMGHELEFEPQYWVEIWNYETGLQLKFPFFLIGE